MGDEDAETAEPSEESPSLARLRAALASQDPEECSEVLRAAFAPSEDEEAAAEIQRELVALVLASSSDPKFIASTLRRYLSSIDLVPAQWSVIATGGELLGNNAIRAFALARAK